MRVLVVDDEPEVATSLARGLIEAGIRADYALNTRQARAFIVNELPYDVVVLDLTLNEETDGLAFCRQLHADGSSAAVLMLTARDDIRDRLAGFDAGADDYLSKPFFFDEVLARVRALNRRRTEAPQAAHTGVGNVSLNNLAREVKIDGQVVPFTRKEFDLLELLIRHSNQVLTTAQILDAIWGESPSNSPSLVEVYVSKLRRKFADSNASITIRSNRGVGYRLEAIT
jgi:DNA-binding response OmpR family regulator